MKKKEIFLNIILVFLGMAFRQPILQDNLTELTSGDWQYQIVEGTASITGYTGNSAVVNVPAGFDQIQVISIGENVFRDSMSIEEIILPVTLTTIGENAFSGCVNLKKVFIPQTVTSIAGSAFRDCRSLQTIEIPENVTNIGSSAFQGCTSLKNIDLPGGIKTINTREFAGCSELESVSIPAAVETIQVAAFENSPSINLEVLYDTAGEQFAKANSIPYTYLVQNTADFSWVRSEDGTEILSYIGQIYDLNIPAHLDGAPVWRIGPGAFQENASVRSVALPETVTEIGAWAFAYVEMLKSVRISEGTTKIGANAFTGSRFLSELIIPASVTEIGEDAFTDCPELTIQTINGSTAWKEAERQGIPVTDPLSVSGDFRLAEADGLYVLTGYTGTDTKLTLLSDVLGLKITKVGDNAFNNSLLEEIRIPEGYKSIGNTAFASMTQPVTMILPDSLTDIAPDAFDGSTVIFQAHTGTVAEQYARKHGIKFLSVYESGMTFQKPILQDEPQKGQSELISGDWRYRIKYGILSVIGYSGFSAVVEVPASFDEIPVTSIGEGLFRDHTEIEQVILPDSVLTIGTAAFSGCTSLKLVKLPAGLTRINNEAFRYCTALESIEFPQKLNSIQYAAFEGCESLNNLILPDSVTSIGANAFNYCSALSSLTLSKNLRSLGGNAFARTPWLASQTDEFVMIGSTILLKYNGTSAVVGVPETVTSIVDAFVDNVNVEEIILPATLTTIGENAFSGCVNLKTVVIPQTVTGIGSNAFKGCSSLQTIAIPEKVTSINGSAFQECTNLKNINIPIGIKTINAREFAFCPGLESVSIPATVETIHTTAFENSPNIKLKVVYGTAGEAFAIANMIPYTYLVENSADFSWLRGEDGVDLVSYIGQIYDVAIPSHLDGIRVWRIDPGAFQENPYARNVILPDTVKEIGEWAFSYIDGMKSVHISGGTTKIGANAFTGCSNLTEIVIPVSVTEIGDDAFTDCPNLTIQAISGSYAWKEAKRLGLSVIDPLSVSGDFQLREADGINVLTGYLGTETKLTLLSDVPGFRIMKVGDNVFNFSSIEEIRIPEGYKIIGNYAFAYMKEPVTIVLPDSLKEISPSAFNGTAVTFRAHIDSVAEQYAREHGIKFIVNHE